MMSILTLGAMIDSPRWSGRASNGVGRLNTVKWYARLNQNGYDNDLRCVGKCKLRSEQGHEGRLEGVRAVVGEQARPKQRTAKKCKSKQWCATGDCAGMQSFASVPESLMNLQSPGRRGGPRRAREHAGRQVSTRTSNTW